MVAKDHGSTDTGYAAPTTTRNGTRYLTFDRAVLLTGAKARAAKAAQAWTPTTPRALSSRTTDRKLRTYQLTQRSRSTGRSSGQVRHAPPGLHDALPEFAGSRKASAHTPFTLTFKGGKVVRITETYLA